MMAASKGKAEGGKRKADFSDLERTHVRRYRR